MTPIRTATNTAGAPIPVGTGPFDIAITPNGKTAYVLNSAGDTVTPIRTATNTAGPPIPVGNEPFGIAITPNGKTAYVTGRNRLSNPDPDRHQHRRTADHGRDRPECHRDHLTRPPTRHGGQAIPGRTRRRKAAHR